MIMKQQFRMFRRGEVYWCQNNETGKQSTLKTKNKKDANRLLHHMNEAGEKSALNLQIARTYLKASSPKFATRNWQETMEAILETKTGETKIRWERAIKDTAFDPIRNLPLLETDADHFLAVLKSGTVATNVFLRRIQNFALDMNWIPWAILAKKKWIPVRYKDKRAITHAEHQRIIAREGNAERRAFYELCWCVGGSQSDVANLQAENIDQGNRCLAYFRQKTKSKVQMFFGDETLKVLQDLPKSGPLFPYLSTVRACDRATEFKQRCLGLGIGGITLHSYRYSWAERAVSCGYPERFAQLALGHNSKAVSRAYARKAQVNLPSMENTEKNYLKDCGTIVLQEKPVKAA